MSSTSKRALLGCAGLVASLALLSGCGSSGGSGGGPATTAGGANAFDGTGSEALGYWVLKITGSTGFYADDHIAPVGITVGCGLFFSGSNLQFGHDSDTVTGAWSGINLTADTATKTYKATGVATTVRTSSTGYFGPREGQIITENWTITPMTNGARLTISGTASGGGTGTVTADLLPVAPNPMDSGSYTDHDWYGYGSKSNNALYANSTNVAEFYDWNPGVEGYFYWDAGYEWDEYLYVDLFYQEGNVLKGGGWYEGGRDTGVSTYGVVSITLDSSGHPIAEHIDLTEGYAGATAHPTVDAAHFTNGYALETMYDPNDHAHTYTLTVDSVTAGGELATAFGVASTTSQFYDYGYGVRFSDWNWVYTGNNQATTRSGVVYSDALYHNTSASYPSNDFDSNATTEERSTVTVNYDSTADHRATGGSIVLQIYNNSHVLQSTETLTFTLTH